MKKSLLFLPFLFTISCLSSCFGSVTTYPNMVEYSNSEVLEVVKEKYDIDKFLFTDMPIKGKVNKNEEEIYEYTLYSSISNNFINPDNIEKAFTSFAGKNGNHDVQGHYRYFLCYCALGITKDNQAKYLYYNTNIDKNENIKSTIGSSDYNQEVLPNEITENTYGDLSSWNDMYLYINKHFRIGGNYLGFDYSKDRLSLSYNERYHGLVTMEFYKENANVVCDLYYAEDEKKEDERYLVYSTSSKYGVIYNYYGMDKSLYFDIDYSINQSEEDKTMLLLKGEANIINILGDIIYSQLTYSVTFLVEKDNKITMREESEKVINVSNIEKGYLLSKLENQEEKASFTINDFYILYEKK